MAVTKAEVRGIEVERASLAARLVGERVEVSKVDLEGRGVRAEARGTVRTDGTAADVTATAAAEFAAIDPAVPTTLGGLVTVRATARGALDALRVSLSGTGERLVVGPTTVERATVSLDLDAPGSEKAKGQARVALFRPTLAEPGVVEQRRRGRARLAEPGPGAVLEHLDAAEAVERPVHEGVEDDAAAPGGVEMLPERRPRTPSAAAVRWMRWSPARTW